MNCYDRLPTGRALNYQMERTEQLRLLLSEVTGRQFRSCCDFIQLAQGDCACARPNELLT